MIMILQKTHKQTDSYVYIYLARVFFQFIGILSVSKTKPSPTVCSHAINCSSDMKCYEEKPA